MSNDFEIYMPATVNIPQCRNQVYKGYNKVRQDNLSCVSHSCAKEQEFTSVQKHVSFGFTLEESCLHNSLHSVDVIYCISLSHETHCELLNCLERFLGSHSLNFNIMGTLNILGQDQKESDGFCVISSTFLLIFS